MLIVDLTDIAKRAHKCVLASGIPRLVSSLSQELQIIRGVESDLVFGYYADIIDSYVLLNLKQNFNFDYIKQKPNLAVSKRPFYPEKYNNKPIKYAFHSTKHRLKTISDKLSISISNNKPSSKEIYEFQAGDNLLMLGAGWDANQLIQHISEKYPHRNFNITILVHDLIHTLLPDVEGRVMREVFETWLHSILRLNADILCYSQNTRRDVLRFCASNGIAAPRTHVIPLVHELKQLDPGPVREEVSRLTKQDYVLFVGPLRGRKNGLLLMQFWQRLADELGGQKIPRLVLAGASGPEDIPESYRDALTPHVIFIRRPNDDELAALYQHTAFSVFLSMYEGWGLPVGESLWHGKTCLVADNSSLREVGGPFCEYVDLDDTEAVYAKLKQMVSNKSYIAALNERIDKSKLRSWHDFASELSCLYKNINTETPDGSKLTFDATNCNSPSTLNCSSIAGD